MAFDVSWVYKIVDSYSAPLKRIQKVTNAASKAANKSSAAFKKMGDKMAGFKSMIASVAGIATIVFPTKKAIDFEDIMIDVKKVMTFKTPDQFQKFREGVFKTSIAIGKLPQNIAEIAVQGGKLGILPEKLSKFIDLVARTSTAFDMLEGPAAETIGSIKTKLGLTIKTTGDLMDAINLLADSTSTSGKRAVEVVSRTVGTMKAIKMPPELVAGWAAFADQIEVSPELASSGLNMMIVRMMKMPGMMKKLLKDPSKAIRDFLGKFAKMTEVNRAKKVFKKFGDEAGRFVLKTVGNMQLLDKTLGFVSNKNKFAGSMMKELQKKLAGTKTAIGRIKAVADVAMIEFGQSILPIIKELTPSIIKMVVKIRDFIKLNSGLVKVAIVVGVITIAITTLSVAIGIASAGFSALFALVGAILSPIGLIFVGVAAVVGGMAYLYMKSQKVRDSFSGLIEATEGFGAAFQPIFTSLSKLFGMTETTISMFSVFETIAVGVIKGITFVIKDLTMRINIVVGAMRMIVNLWKTVGKFIAKASIGTVNKVVHDFKEITGMERTKPEIAPVASDREAVRGQINGRIEVAASPGTEVRKTEFDHSASGDVGFNMAFP